MLQVTECKIDLPVIQAGRFDCIAPCGGFDTVGSILLSGRTIRDGGKLAELLVEGNVMIVTKRRKTPPRTCRQTGKKFASPAAI